MATPDMQHLFERFLQIYGGRNGSTEPARSEPRYQSQPAYSAPADAYTSDGYAPPTGGVLGGWSSPSPAAPWWFRALSGSGGMPGGLRGPRLGGSIGGLPFVPMPPRPEDVVEIPNPHLEKAIPQSMRDFWTAGSLVSRTIGDHLRDGRAPESDVQAPFPQPEDRSNGLGWYVGPPLLEEEIERSKPRSDDRILQRVDDDATSKMKIASPPLAPDDPADTEGCDEEWAEARRICEKRMSGPPGQGPASKPLGRRGRRFTIEDCMNGIVSARCGGNPLKDGLSGREAAERNNKAIRKKRGR